MGHGVNLTAQTGSVGEESNPLAVATAPDGQLNVSASNGNVYLKASSTIFNVGSISSAGATSITGQNVEDVRVQAIRAKTLNIVAGSRILHDGSDILFESDHGTAGLIPGILYVSDELTLSADSIYIANLINTGTGLLPVSVGGITGMADSVTIRATSDSDYGIRFSRLEASYSLIDADVGLLELVEARVGSSGLADIRNGHLRVIADNSAWTLHDCDVQLRPPIGLFYLAIGREWVQTNAEVVNKADGINVYEASGPQAEVREAASLVDEAVKAAIISDGLFVIGGGFSLTPLQGFGQPGLGVVTVQPGLMSGGTGGSDEGEEEF